MAILTSIATLARAAGAAILVHYEGPIESRLKDDGSPLTLADQAAERLIAAGLAELDPGTPVLSEEGCVPEYSVRSLWRRFWLVDPLDGTKEFIQRNGEFTVNIGLIEDGEPVLGVVYAPALDLLYRAAKGSGAWKEEAGRPPERIYSSVPPPSAALTIVESRSHPSHELETYLQTLRVGRRVTIGSSLKFCWVAEGKADVYPRLGPTMEWDVAAGDCIYRNAVREGQNRSPFVYNKPDLRNEPFVLGPVRLAANQ
jgi:3'(2'), 5'-bisphosphate nucleotidase